MIFKAMLFDADGTLYDSTMLHFEAYKKVSRDLYDFDFTKKLFFDECIDLYKNPTQVLREHNINCKDEDFYSKKRPYYYQIAKEKLRPTPGLTKLLKQAKENDIPCAIVSGASRNSLEDSLNILGISDFFCFRIAREDSPKQKPSPSPYQLAIKKLNLPTDQCLAFEDTKSGIESTKKANLYCIGIRNTTNNDEQLSNANLIVSNLDQLNYRFENGFKILL